MSVSGPTATGGTFRLKNGGQLDRSRAVRFTFDGATYRGFIGDTLASALVANGVKLVGRSFKYHRPRGILTAGSEEPNALVELRSGARREPNTRATTAELYEGLDATSQNSWPSLAFDVLSVNQLAAPIFGAGFYYKTFMWPPAFWEKVYEPLIRRAAGLGRAATAEDPDQYEKAFAYCDLLVIGAGPSGFMAALAAARAGLRVIVCNEDFAWGGRLLSEDAEIDDAPASHWVSATVAELASLPNVTLMPRTTVYGVYDGGTYGAVERVNDHRPMPPPFEPRQRLWRIQAQRSILAAGALERPLVFGGNDRPGIMLAGAARTYLKRYAAIPARRAVIFTCCDDGWRTAKAFVDRQIEVAAIVDARPLPAGGTPACLKTTAARVFHGAEVTATSGRLGISGVTVRDAAGNNHTIACDGLFMSGGWLPTLNLTCHLGGKPFWNEGISAFVPGALPPGMIVAGSANGDKTLARCLAAGVAAASTVVDTLLCSGVSTSVPRAVDEPSQSTPLWVVKGSVGKAFVDYQNDVTTSDVGLAAREGYRSVELFKRYTTLGMGTDQGKTSNLNGQALLAAARGSSIEQVGTTVYRPPYTPVAIGALAGHHRGKEFRPTRVTPAHAWAVEQGAVMRAVGPWERAGWFPRSGEKDWLEAATRETNAVRASVGVCDVSTLGKIDIQGPDAATLLDRVYCNTFSTLPVGRARYGLMLRDDGLVMDDGTTSRLGAEHFVMTTTTANAVAVMQHLDFCIQALWPALDVQLASVSEQWAQFSLAGPQSRRVLEGVVDRQHDISNAAFPFMAARAVTILGGLPARLFRISFSGELAYELAVPAREGDKAVRAVIAAGAEFGITPYGLEALAIMRVEKGHVAGSELNGQTTAHDLGLGKMMSSKKDYIGRAMADRPAFLKPDRWQLVGLKPVDRTQRLRSGAHLLAAGRDAKIEHDEGYVTSTAYSPTLGHWIALALVKAGRSRHGHRLTAVDPLRDSSFDVNVCDPVFYDPEGKRLHD